MACDVIIMGAAGRMGGTLVRLAQADPELNLCGACERPEHLGRIGGLGCPSAQDLADLLPDNPGAVVVDFTSPESSLRVAELARKHGNPAVIGTTGFKAVELEELRKKAVDAPLFWSPNMSVGVNVLLRVLPALARMLGPEYDQEMVEIHHNKKADAPSGTALKLAQCLAEASGVNLDDVARYCREGITGARPAGEIGIQALRGGDVVGDHTVYFLGPGERIEVTHRAHSRETFAQGALRAAKWLRGQKAGRLYAMADMLG